MCYRARTIFARPRLAPALSLIFGAGFPPYRGGVLRHADATGLETVVDRLRSLRAEKGPRFEPCALLVMMAEREKRFTGAAGS